MIAHLQAVATVREREDLGIFGDILSVSHQEPEKALPGAGLPTRLSVSDPVTGLSLDGGSLISQRFSRIDAHGTARRQIAGDGRDARKQQCAGSETRGIGAAYVEQQPGHQPGERQRR